MLYPKNVPNVERFIRILAGVVMIAIALFAGLSPVIGAILIFSAVFLALTGFVGWCPACAMVGRKLK